MFSGIPALTHEQQQVAVERIHELMAQGVSSGQAIACVAQEIRENHKGERIHVMFDEEDEEQETPPEYDDEESDEQEEE